MTLKFGFSWGKLLQSAALAVLACLLAATLAACDSGSNAPTAVAPNPNNTAPTAPASDVNSNIPKKATNTVNIGLDDGKILPSNLGIPAGNTTFLVTNNGSMPHNLAIYSSDGKLLGKTKDLTKADGTKPLVLDVPGGTYKMISDVAGDEAKGLTSVLNVSK